MRISKNAHKDMMILSFVHALLEVSKNDNNEDGLQKRDNKSFRANKRIDSRLDTLQIKIKQSIDEMYKLGGNNTIKWMKNNLKDRVGETLTKLQEETVNLELLALNVLYINFCDYRGNLKLMAAMKWIMEDTKYILDTMDLFAQTAVSKIEGEMYQASMRCIQRIKR